MKLAEIAAKIDYYLKRMEADSGINAPVGGRVTVTRPYYNAGSWAAGRYVQVRYVIYQGTSSLSKKEALEYLKRLDAGQAVKHWERDRDHVFDWHKTGDNT